MKKKVAGKKVTVAAKAKVTKGSKGTKSKGVQKAGAKAKSKTAKPKSPRRTALRMSILADGPPTKTTSP